MPQRHLTHAALLLFCLLAVGFPTVRAQGEEVGEFHIPQVVPLDDAQLAELRRLVADDPEAAAIAAAEREAAEPLVDLTPKPLAVIHYEGLVNTHPDRIATVADLRQTADAARLLRHWQLSGDPRAADALERLIIAWAGTYEPTGNDVNENKLYPLLVAYAALRDDFADEDRQQVDAWVAQLGDLHARAVAESEHFTNRYSKHVRLLAICGRILGRPEWIEVAYEGVRRFVSESLYADGSSRDLERRDSLTYHGSALKPPMELAMIAGAGGVELYEWTAPDGGSLKKSVDYLVPYATGEKTHAEWVDSQIDLDRRRAEARLEKYRPGRLYEPSQALEVMEAASYFDPSLLRVVRQLTSSEAKRFPTWRTLINTAARASAEDEGA